MNAYGKTASGEQITDALIDELCRKAEAGYETEEMTDPAAAPVGRALAPCRRAGP